MSWVIEHMFAIVALIVAISAFISTQRNISHQVKANALILMERKISDLNIKLEAEVIKLQDGLDRCIRERIIFKEEITSLKRALKAANIEVEELNTELNELNIEVKELKS